MNRIYLNIKVQQKKQVAEGQKQHDTICIYCEICKQYIVYMPTSDQISHSVVSDSLRPHESKHASLPCPSPTPRVHSDSRPSSQ